jgi:hypothetical protein
VGLPHCGGAGRARTQWAWPPACQNLLHDSITPLGRSYTEVTNGDSEALSLAAPRGLRRAGRARRAGCCSDAINS